MKIHGIKINSLKHDNDIPLMDGSKNPLLKVNYNSDKLALSYIFLPVVDLVFHEETKKTLCFRFPDNEGRNSFILIKKLLIGNRTKGYRC